MPPRNKGLGNLSSDETWDFELYGSSFKASNSDDSRSRSSANQSLNLVLGLPQSIKLHILQFLDIVSLAQTRAVNHDLHQLLKTSPRSAEAAYHAVWKPAVSRQWPWLETNDPQMRFQDSCWTTTSLAGENGSCPDLVRLLSLAADTQSHAVDQDLLVPPPQSPTRAVLHGRVRSSHQSRSQEEPPQPQLRLIEGAPNVVLFCGPLGVGDRCVRAKDPLPHPTAGATTSSQSQKQQQHKPKRRSSGSRLCWCTETAQKLLRCKPTKQQPVMAVQWKPFVAPFADSASTYNLSPRLVSYFEILILPTTQNDSDGTSRIAQENFITGPTSNNNNNNTTADCVVVGVALRDFQLHKYMPGWCQNSFGYHGDDGGFYHDSGRPHTNVHLPTYGAGDCVGCGVDYIQRALFFTKNGHFLGCVAPLSEAQLRREWFPVVGVDTHSPVQCNFGTSTDAPFRYDLSGLVKRQRDEVLRALASSTKQ